MKRQNLRTLATPNIVLSCNLCGSSDAFEERTWPHGAADTELAKVVGKIKQSVPKFDTGNILANIDGFTCRLSFNNHCPPLSLATTEQVGSSPQFFLPCNELTPVIDESIATFRQTEKPFRGASSETTQPANDNEPDRQADAA